MRAYTAPVSSQLELPLTERGDASFSPAETDAHAPAERRDAPYALVLVHGTFAARATWVESDSPLVQAIARRLGKPACVLSFRWSGRNSHVARLKAADSLKGALRQLSQAHRGVRIYVIAHSHGGNVALYALRDPQLQSSVGGLVILGTPLISCSRRDIGSIVYVLRVIPWLLFLALGTILVSVSTASMEPMPKYVLWQPITAAVIALLVDNVIGRHIIQRLPQWQTKLIEALTPPTLINVPMLSLSALSDEAYLHLRVQRLLAAAPYVVFQRLFGLMTVLLGIGTFVAFRGVWSRQFGIHGIFSDVILGGTLVLTCWMVAKFISYPITLALLVTVWIWQLLTSGSPFGFGRHLIGSELLVEVHAERGYPSHTVECRSYQFPATRWSRFFPGNWWHGRYYQDARCLRDIANWIATH